MNGRRYDYDILRSLSMLAVIFLHCAVGPLRQLDCPGLWNFSNFWASVANPAVPLFFMISGALLLSDPRTGDLRQLFTHRLPKILLPLCTWSALILLYRFYQDPEAAKTALMRIFFDPVAVPYWFLYALLPIYLISPMLQRMASGLSDSQWHYMMALWLFLTLGLHTLRTFFPVQWGLFFTQHPAYNIDFVGGYLGYFLLGAYLERWKRSPKPLALSALWALSTAAIALGTHWDSYTSLTYTTRFSDYLTLLSLIQAVSLFLLAKALFRNRESKGRLIPLLSACSFSTYLLHPPVIGLIKLCWVRLFETAGPVTVTGLVGFYLSVLLISVLGSIILSLLPGVCYLFTGQPKPLRLCQKREKP